MREHDGSIAFSVEVGVKLIAIWSRKCNRLLSRNFAGDQQDEQQNENRCYEGSHVLGGTRDFRFRSRGFQRR